MQVKAEDLSNHLSSHLSSQRGGSIKPVYLVSGDETLLVEEACDQIIQAARAAGFSERSVHYVEAGFHWHDLYHDAASLSLFAQRKVLDVRVPVKKFDRQASEALREWMTNVESNVESNQSDDPILLLRTTRLEPRQRSSAWFKALDKVGVITLIWPMSVKQLPNWISARLRSAGLDVEKPAISYLCDRVEGNLLAAAQEVEKLALLQLSQPISIEAMAQALEDTSRFNSFDLLDAMMAGDGARSSRILNSLKDEGVALFAIMGALTSQLRRMGNSRGLPPARQRVMEQFARRIKDVVPVLSECAIIDQQGKGQRYGDAWISLENLLLRLAGQRSLPLPSEDMKLLS